MMASKLQQLQSKACQASQFVAKHGTSYYKQLLEQNKQYIQEPPTVEKCSLLSKQLFYTRLASIPGRTESFWKELDYVKNLWKNRQELKVEDAGIAALFGLECFAWFCAGEIVGRGFTFTGYYV
ncbi:F-type H+-transporting ATPase subunit g [Senna tora]|uniref:F-type H+-transporting ATPase subunit g n=1 Tax=Senna tora TaxID=362788 RepID=A0A834T129_9FABA|nr:F-type H+-transporting ATPase subunit g [Senna tora]